MIRFQGLAHEAALFFEKEQLCDREMWKRFAEVFRIAPDGENKGWRGEYWGKTMRGGALIYAYTGSPALYGVLTDAVKDLLTVADADGRVSSYPRETELCGWDVWCRKYVILGCEYYLEICRDEGLKEEILRFIKGCADAILREVGDGKTPVTATSHRWYGVNSSSILEPMVKLYRLTGEEKYLEFATHIVENGGAAGFDLIELAYENRLLPYQYGVSKAYEMTSFFEGLLEYYKVTGIEKYKTAVIHYAEAVMASEVSIIGSCGITHELFDHTRTRQTTVYDGVSQETCVTVTWMKFCARLLELTGDSRYADEMERSFYNAYLGALNVERKESSHPYEWFVVKKGITHYVPTFLPTDSYSPLIPGKRGRVVGGSQLLHDFSYYGCCAAISAAGVGVFLDRAVTVEEDCVTVNFFERGTAQMQVKGVPVSLEMETDYPVDGKIRLKVKAERPVAFTLKVRNPGWQEGTHGYALYTKEWSEDLLEFCLEMPVRLHTPVHWEEDVVYTDITKDVGAYRAVLPVSVKHEEAEDRFVAVTRGPLTLAADSRTGKRADSVFDVKPVAVKKENDLSFPCLLNMEFTDGEGKPFTLVDYASAGRDWESTIAAWLPTK